MAWNDEDFLLTKTIIITIITYHRTIGVFYSNYGTYNPSQEINRSAYIDNYENTTVL